VRQPNGRRDCRWCGSSTFPGGPARALHPVLQLSCIRYLFKDSRACSQKTPKCQRSGTEPPPPLRRLFLRSGIGDIFVKERDLEETREKSSRVRRFARIPSSCCGETQYGHAKIQTDRGRCEDLARRRVRPSSGILHASRAARPAFRNSESCVKQRMKFLPAPTLAGSVD